jgi:hypothetical protein
MENEIIEGKIFRNIKITSLLTIEGNKYSTEIVKQRCQHNRSRSYFTTDGQSAYPSWCRDTPLGLMTIFFFFLSFDGQLLCSSSWGVLSGERTGL